MNGAYNKVTPAELIILAIIVVLLVVFNRSIRRMGTRRLITCSILCAVAGAAGAQMRSIPGVQPTSFIVIFCGMAFGPGPALCCGIVSALVFDLMSFITQYTVWRMILWGLMGLLAGFMPRLQKPAAQWSLLAVYGFIWGFLFGWVSNSVVYFNGTVPFAIETFIASCVFSAPFELSHALTNAVLLSTLGYPLMKLLSKIDRNVIGVKKND